jgi:hypothetical protein
MNKRQQKYQQEVLLAYALVMAITAPKHRVMDAVAFAESLAVGLSPKQVERAKLSAERTLSRA